MTETLKAEDEPVPTHEPPPDDSGREQEEDSESDEEQGPTSEPSGTTDEPPTGPIKTTDEPPTPLAQKTTRDPSTESDHEALYHNICPPESTGREFNRSSNSTTTRNTVFVVNGLSALGARITYALAGDTNWQVLSIASLQDRLCGDPLLLHRQDTLRKIGVRSIFVDWSDTSSIGHLFEANLPSHVIIVPPNVVAGGGSSSERSEFNLDASMWSAALSDFLNLLETVRSLSPETRLTLISVSKSVKNELELVTPGKGTMSLLETLVGSFELSLSTYHTLYQIPFSVLRVNGFHGFWTHQGLKSDNSKPIGCFIDDVVSFVYSSLSLDYNCIVLDFGLCDPKTSPTVKYALDKVSVTRLTAPAMAVAKTKNWKSLYEKRKTIRLVLTSYFTGRGLHPASDRSLRLLRWAESLKNLEVEAVVLHSGLGTKFIDRVQKHYPHVHFEFVHLPFDYGTNSNCRESVLAFSNYLENRDDIGSVLIVELDRELKRNVFSLMETMGDWLYTDRDIVAFRDVLNNATDTESTVSMAKSIAMGGSRHLVLATLNKMAACLHDYKNLTTAPVLQCLMDRHFVQHAFTGWPLSTAL